MLAFGWGGGWRQGKDHTDSEGYFLDQYFFLREWLSPSPLKIYLLKKIMYFLK